MLLYVFLVAALNVAMGFAVAAYLGRRCRAAVALAPPWPAEASDVPPEGVASPAEQREEPAEREKTASTTWVETLQTEVNQFNDRLVQTDEDLRSLAGTPDAATIEKRLQAVLAATEEYLDRRSLAHDEFREMHRQEPALREVGDNLQAAFQREDQRIESSRARIEAFDYENDLAEGVRQMVGETGKLLDANRQVRDVVPPNFSLEEREVTL